MFRASIPCHANFQGEMVGIRMPTREETREAIVDPREKGYLKQIEISNLILFVNNICYD